MLNWTNHVCPGFYSLEFGKVGTSALSVAVKDIHFDFDYLRITMIISIVFTSSLY